MAVMTGTAVPNGDISFGNAKGKFVDFIVGTYATGGLAVDPAKFGFGKDRPLLGCIVVGGNAASTGYNFQYDTANKKLVAYVAGAGTVTGNVTVGGGAAGEPLGITPDSNAGALTKNAATARTIPIATFLGAAPTAATTLAQVGNGTDLSLITVRLLGIGW